MRRTAANDTREARMLTHPRQEKSMTQRISHIQQLPELFKRFLEFSNQLEDSAIEESIRDLVSIRTSQISGCGFCVECT